MTEYPAAPTTEAGRRYIEKLHRDDPGMQRLSSGRFHLGAVITDAEDAVAQIEAEARSTPAETLDVEAVNMLRRIVAVRGRALLLQDEIEGAKNWLARLSPHNREAGHE
jgi:hypothetical protein